MAVLERVRGVYRRTRFGDPLVVVSGLPRSGTSMAMSMLAAGGVPLVEDGQRTADEDNPKGYFEDERVKDLHLGQDNTWLRAARGHAIKIISYLLEHLPDDNNYQVLFMIRDLEEVLASQRKMLERRGEPQDSDDERMRTVYEQHLWKVRYRLRRYPKFQLLEVPYREVLEQPREHAERMREFLGRDLDISRMTAVVDERLYRNRAG